jgi:CPA2 family monovalent cation:H+ antiporter-2
MESYRLKIVLLLTIGFALASFLGWLTQKFRLSPLLGYLLGGYLIGPYSPGFEADLEVSEQLAEIGVILMMFGVGLHFRWEELSSVRHIAIPGAVLQTAATAIISALLMYFLDWTVQAGLIIGLAIGVASTVVLVRVLSDNNLLNTPQGHVAVGWLIVEDILTVAALILLPIWVEGVHGENASSWQMAESVVWLVVKFCILTVVLFSVGLKIVTYILNSVARTRSHELFTITVLALTFAVATGSSIIFGTSIALGAFIAGMVIGRTDLRHQALANSLALKDVFVVIFFLSIGMLFDPKIMVNQFWAFLGILSIIIFIKPLVAYLIVITMHYPVKTALTVAIALGQIGEFSFILAEESSRLKVLPDDGYDIIVACALVSIALNPIIFSYIESFCGLIERKTHARSQNLLSGFFWENPPKAIVVGYGPIGQSAVKTLSRLGYDPVIIDRNVDTVAKLNSEHIHAIFGDASHEEILQVSHIESAGLLVITVPEISVVMSIIHAVRRLNPTIQILARSKYKADEIALKEEGISFVSTEDEAIKAFNHAVFKLTDSYSRGYHHSHI